MVKGKQIDAWNHTSVVISKIHNVNCTKVSDMISPADVHPFSDQYIAKVQAAIEREQNGPTEAELSQIKRFVEG